MANLNGKEYSRSDLLARIGNTSQVCGVERVTLADGREQGVEALLFDTGSGFSFTALPGRGMDISRAAYNGLSLCWRSAVGQVGPSYFERAGFGWLRSFFGGLLTTCGLTDVGDPCVDPDLGRDSWQAAIREAAAGRCDTAVEEIRRAMLADQVNATGIHGRISNTPAERVSVSCEWEGDDCVISASGTVREANSFGEDLSLRRTICSKLGERKLSVHDVVVNEGYEPTPHMILYHLNAGFPVLDADSRLILPTRQVIPRDAEAEQGRDAYAGFGPPTPGFQEQVFYHDLAGDSDGKTCAAIVNERIADGLGLYVRFSLRQLPRFVQWKMLGERTYVVGLEPANCWVGGRSSERKRGTLQILEPGESRNYDLEIGVLVGSEIAAFSENAMDLLADNGGA